LNRILKFLRQLLLVTALDNLRWFGHATLSLDAGNSKILFIDPYNLKSAPKQKADIVFITHTHYDHCSPKDLKQVITPATFVVSVPGCAEKIVPKEKLILVKPNEHITLPGFSDIHINTIPAYNIKPERLKFHPRANNWVGYIISTPVGKIYHAGDTDFVPEMKNLKTEKLGVAMLPIGGTFTMNVDEAIEAANAISAEVTVPIHYKALLKDNAQSAEKKFESGVKGKVKIMPEVA